MGQAARDPEASVQDEPRCSGKLSGANGGSIAYAPLAGQLKDPGKQPTSILNLKATRVTGLKFVELSQAVSGHSFPSQGMAFPARTVVILETRK